MKRFGFFLLIVSFSAAAQYSGPAVETCLAYASNEIRQSAASAARVVFDRDRDLAIERYTRKAGYESAVSAFRRSADAWRAYRDAECARRSGPSTSGASGDADKACLVELTRRRALDLR